MKTGEISSTKESGGSMMKLKVLPPTLRKNNHYLAVDVICDNILDKNSFVNLIWDGCIRFWGELGTADFNLWVMNFIELKSIQGHKHYRAVVRCQRGYEESLRSALCCINTYKNKKISITTIGLCGTIRSCVDKYL